MTRRKSSIVTARRAAHTAEVLLGDARAIQTGRIGQRAANRLLGRAVASLMRNAWR